MEERGIALAPTLSRDISRSFAITRRQGAVDAEAVLDIIRLCCATTDLTLVAGLTEDERIVRYVLARTQYRAFRTLVGNALDSLKRTGRVRPRDIAPYSPFGEACAPEFVLHHLAALSAGVIVRRTLFRQ
jgi:hypothetical protein